MTKEPWWMTAKLYELYVDKFAGDLPGLTQRLPYFSELGITALHLLPHYPSPMVDEGYDISDYRGVRPGLGTMGDFAQLLKEAHAQGLKIIIDFVLNHTSDQHPWFVESASSLSNPKRNWYLWSETGMEFAMGKNAFPDIKERNWIPTDTGFYYATFYPQQPDLNWDNEEVFEAMLSTMEYWAELGVDGFRIDAAPFLAKREDCDCMGHPDAHKILKRIRARLSAKHPDVILLGEAHQHIESIKSYFGDGDECHMMYNFPLMEQFWLALMESYIGEEARADERIVTMLNKSAEIPAGCQWATFLRNHDEISLATLPVPEREALLGFLDGDSAYLWKKARATSVRVATAMRGDPRRIMRALELLYRTPGAPIMYYGDEIGMQNLPVHDGVIDTRHYVRGAFDWGEAEKQMHDPDSLWHQAAELIHSAKALPAGTPKVAIPKAL